MIDAGAVLSLLVVEAIGLAVLSLAWSEPERWSPAARLGLAFGLGLIVLTTGLFVLSLLGLVPSPWSGVAILVVVASAAAMVRGPLEGLRRLLAREDSSGGWLASVSLVLIAGLCAVAGIASLLEPVVEWDVLAIWALKAKVLLHEPVGSSAYFHDASKAYSHLDYPLLWPMAMAWTWCCSRTEDLQTVKVLSPALLAALAATSYGVLRRIASRSEALLLTTVVAGSPMVLSQSSRLLADAVLALFVLAAFACCSLWLEFGHEDDLRLAGLFTAGMLFTKNEGMGVFAVLLAYAGACLVVRRRWRALPGAAAWLAGVPVAMTVAWFAFRAGIPKLHEDYGSRLDPARVVENASRIPAVLGGWARHAAAFDDWLFFWPLFLAVVMWTATRWARTATAFLVAAVGGIVFLYACVHIVSPWDVEVLVASTTSRLLLQVAPLGVFVLAACAREAGWLGGRAGFGIRVD